jgi:hypothetical protein
MRYPTCDADVEDASPSEAETVVHVRDANALMRQAADAAHDAYVDVFDSAWAQFCADMRSREVLRVHRTHVPWIWSRQ